MKRNLFLLMLSFFPLLCMGQKNVNVDEAKKMMEKNKQLQIVDVRTPQEFASGHIEGAINIDWRDASFPDKIVKLKKKKAVLIYCRSGRRSLSAMNKMMELGFKETYNMEGGILEWGKKKYKILIPAAPDSTDATTGATRRVPAEQNSTK